MRSAAGESFPAMCKNISGATKKGRVGVRDPLLREQNILQQKSEGDT